MTERTQRLLLMVAFTGLTLGVGYTLQKARQNGVLGLAPAIAPGLSARFALRLRDVRVTGYEKGVHAWTLQAPVIDTERDRRTLRFSGGLKATFLDRGKTAALLTAPDAAFTDQTKLDFLGGLSATFLQNGKPRARLTAPNATFDTQSKAFRATGAITVTVAPATRPQRGEIPASLGQLTIRCGQLAYSVGTKIVHCPGPVYIVLENRGEVWANDLTLNIETHDLSLGDTRARLRGGKDDIL